MDASTKQALKVSSEYRVQRLVVKMANGSSLCVCVCVCVWKDKGLCGSLFIEPVTEWDHLSEGQASKHYVYSRSVTAVLRHSTMPIKSAIFT